MTIRANLLSCFASEPTTLRRRLPRPMLLPDLTQWYAHNQERGRLPDEWQDYDPSQIARSIGVPVWLTVQPWEVTFDDEVEVEREETKERRTVTIHTEEGDLEAEWTRASESDPWIQSDYLLSSQDDLPAAAAWAEHRGHELVTEGVTDTEMSIIDDGLMAILLAPRPFVSLMDELLGWENGMRFLQEHAEALGEILEVLEAEYLDLVTALSQLSGQIVVTPDVLDTERFPPDLFESYLQASFASTAEELHVYRKKLLVKAGSPLEALLPLLAETGLDALADIGPERDVDLAQARDLLGSDVTLWGGISPEALLPTTPHRQLEEEVKRAVAQTQDDPRTLIGVAGGVPPAADFGRLKDLPGMVSAARRR